MNFSPRWIVAIENFLKSGSILSVKNFVAVCEKWNTLIFRLIIRFLLRFLSHYIFVSPSFIFLLLFSLSSLNSPHHYCAHPSYVIFIFPFLLMIIIFLLSFVFNHICITAIVIFLLLIFLHTFYLFLSYQLLLSPIFYSTARYTYYYYYMFSIRFPCHRSDWFKW